MWGKNTTVVCVEVSVLLFVLPPILPTLRHISAWKAASVTGKKTHQVFVLEKNHFDGQPLETSVNFPPENTSSQEAKPVIFT